MFPVLVIGLLGGCGGGDDGADPIVPPPPSGEIIDVTVPLEVGTTWTFDQQRSVITQRGGLATSERAEIVSQDLWRDEMWSVQTDTDGRLSDSSYVRQSGKVLYVAPLAYLGANPEQTHLRKWVWSRIAESLPWKIADFRLPPGTTWNLIDAEGTVRLEGDLPVDADVSFEVVASTLGSGPIEVPAGRFDQAYRGWISTQILLEGAEIRVGVQEFYLVDQVGVVASDDHTAEHFPGEDATTTDVSRRLVRLDSR